MKRSVFRILWKFYHKKLHSEYSDDEQTMCGLLMKCMRKKEPESWWLEVCKTDVNALTNQRNNCIKSMNTKYKCKYIQIQASCPTKMPITKASFPCQSLGSQWRLLFILTIRLQHYNAFGDAFYAQILDEFAPCLVLAKYWNNDMKMNLYCCTTDQKLWQQHVLSVSDEAFLVLVLLNYSRRWFAEKMRDIQKVGANDDQLLLLKSLYKDSHHHPLSPTSEKRHLDRQ